MNKFLFLFTSSMIMLFNACSNNSTCNDEPNQSPQIMSLVSDFDTIEVGSSSSLTCLANDPDGDALTFIWESYSGVINGSGSVVDWTAPSVIGTYYIKCKVIDGNGGEDIDSVMITVEIQFPPQGLVAYYPFDGNANDVSGNENNGIIYGNSVQFVSGIFDQAIKFDNSNSGTNSVNDYIELPEITINEFSISHWVKFQSGSSTSFDGCTYSIGVFPSKQLLIRITNEGFIRGYIVINNSQVVTNQVDISDKQWHFIALAVDHNYMRIYSDGLIVDSIGLSSSPDFVNAYQYVALHRFNNSRSSRFTGELDDLYIFNRALSNAEILQLYNKK